MLKSTRIVVIGFAYAMVLAAAAGSVQHVGFRRHAVPTGKPNSIPTSVSRSPASSPSEAEQEAITKNELVRYFENRIVSISSVTNEQDFPKVDSKTLSSSFPGLMASDLETSSSYADLLDNVSARLATEVKNLGSIDSILNALAGTKVSTNADQRKYVLAEVNAPACTTDDCVVLTTECCLYSCCCGYHPKAKPEHLVRLRALLSAYTGGCMWFECVPCY